MHSFQGAVALGLTFALSSCASPSEGAIRAVGPINPRLIEFVQQELKIQQSSPGTRTEFMISYSSGGDVKSLLKLVELVNHHASQVFVSGECLSACAELLYLTSVPLRAAENASIGFHGNALTASALTKRLNLPVSECIEQRAYEFSKLLRGRRVNITKVTDTTIEKLQFYDAEKASSSFRDSCLNYRFLSKKRFWFPTSAQLKQIFGMRLHGSVCADNRECILKFATKQWGPQLDIVIGDDPAIATAILPR